RVERGERHPRQLSLTDPLNHNNNATFGEPGGGVAVYTDKHLYFFDKIKIGQATYRGCCTFLSSN
ncbi:MAG TPA: hypothetical protein PLU64_00750, partial [Saprospiraceae bacterium]|nr:hypothetical protein [Saprospiraceae bacterium]